MLCLFPGTKIISWLIPVLFRTVLFILDEEFLAFEDGEKMLFFPADR
jgi:predicted DNA repair protein MutK